jgi:hypothetical protein
MENKLSTHEIDLLEYSFFSLCEEVDLFFCQHKHTDYFAANMD